jgi:hypothetical protein
MISHTINRGATSSGFSRLLESGLYSYRATILFGIHPSGLCELSAGYINFEDNSNYGAMMSSRQGGDPSSVAVSVPVSTQSQQVQTLYRSHWHLGYRSLSSKRGLPGAQAKGKINRTSVAGIGYRG